VNLGVDGADVLAEYPDEEELHGPKEVDTDQEWCKAELQLVPEHELGYQVAEGHE
jgi:hypothetical protein